MSSVNEKWRGGGHLGAGQQQREFRTVGNTNHLHHAAETVLHGLLGCKDLSGNQVVPCSGGQQAQDGPIIIVSRYGKDCIYARERGLRATVTLDEGAQQGGKAFDRLQLIGSKHVLHSDGGGSDECEWVDDNTKRWGSTTRTSGFNWAKSLASLLELSCGLNT